MCVFQTKLNNFRREAKINKTNWGEKQSENVSVVKGVRTTFHLAIYTPE